ncbi:MAG: transketolase [Clostridiales bacterium]|nr:MAG: transketolase [Clostridiales bacterium]
MTKEQITALKLKANEIRKETIKCIASIGVGHIGGSLSIADVLAVLYFDQMKTDPKNPKWEGRDWLVVSKGHSGPAVYSALAIKGFFDKEILYTLNKSNTTLPSHCDRQKTPGIDMTTGSLGQGASNAAGIALGNKMDGKDDIYTYCITGDGESQEGEIWEQAMFAAHKKLGNLIGFLDYNKLQIDGETDAVNSLGDVVAKYQAFGWHVQKVDGHDVLAIHNAIDAAKAIKDKPSMIILDTIKGKGIKELEGKASCHNANVSEEQMNQYLAELDAEAAAIGEDKQ